MAKQPTIWLTRPQADSESFAEELAAVGIASIVSPSLRVIAEPHVSLTASKPAAILLTSRHAAYALSELPTAWRTLPTYCVGASTAKAAVELGFNHVIPGVSDVFGLLPHIGAALKRDSVLLYLAGRDTRADVVPLLSTFGIKVTTVVVYSALAESILPDNIRTALGDGTINAVVFYSPRSAEITHELMVAAGLADAAKQIHAFCLSLAVAAAAGKLPWAGIHACHAPTRHAMRELVVSHLGELL